MTDLLTATYQRTAEIPLDELTPYPGNAKRGNAPAILESLRRNGQYRSLVVREISNGPLIILAGNHTRDALADHGPGDCGETFPTRDGAQRPCGICNNAPSWTLAARCEIVRCDDATARRINIADNRTAELGTYDQDALAELLSLIAEDGDGYDGTGYTDEDVRLLTQPPLDLDALADKYGDPAADDLWPTLKFKVPPNIRDDFYDLTKSADPDDDDARFMYLINKARDAA